MVPTSRVLFASLLCAALVAAPGVSSALFLKKAVKSVTKTVKKATDKVKSAVTGAAADVKGAATTAGNFISRIASKTGEAFSPAGLAKVRDFAASTWKSVKDNVKKGYDAAVAKVTKLVTDALKAKFIQKAKEDFQKTLEKVKAAASAMKSLLEDKSARDRVWRMLKTFMQGKIDAQSREDLAWVAQKLGYTKRSGKGASRRSASDRALCGYAPWPKSLCISVAVSGTLAKGVAVSAEGSIGGCLDLGVDGSFVDNYNLGLVGSVGGGIGGGIIGAGVDVMVSLNAKKVSGLSGPYIAVTGEFHQKYGLQGSVEWDIDKENFTNPSWDHLIPSVSVGFGVGKGARFTLGAGYAWLIVQRKG
jgi:hypothetical protein